MLKRGSGRPPAAPAAAVPPAAPAEGAMTGMRAAIAAAMARSKREIPHYYLAHTIDLTAAEAFVRRSTTRGASRPSGCCSARCS